MIIVMLALLVPTLAISWRRLHDANLAGPFWFLTFIPGVGGLIVLALMLMPSKPEGRRFDV
ncbi:Predicted membrane protein [Brevibacterium casei]|nr:Predicted membrane protein [Brevibacterium casei]